MSLLIFMAQSLVFAIHLIACYTHENITSVSSNGQWLIVVI